MPLYNATIHNVGTPQYMNWSAVRHIIMYKDHMKLMQFTCSQGCKVREATHWITGHVAGGVLAPTDIDTKTGVNSTTE